MTRKTTYPTVAGLNKALRSLPKHATVELRDASVKIAVKEAGKARGKATSQGGVAKLVAPSIRAGRDRVPVIRMGSSQRLPSNTRSRTGQHQTIGDVMWGAEFGGGRRSTTQQFSPWRGTGETAGYFLYPTIRGDSQSIHDEYSDALLTALKEAK